jgi:AraC-like DNA-binding protein
VAFASCVLLLLAMRQTSFRGRRGARYMIALLSVQAGSFAFEWLMANPSSPAKSTWLALVMALAFFFSPLLWLYARSIVETSIPRLRDVPRAHWIPIAVGLLLLVPLVQATHLGSGFADPTRPTNGMLQAYIHETMLASVAVFALQGLYYLRASLRILGEQARAARALLSDLEDRELNSLRLLIVAVGAHWIVGIARTVHPLLLGKDAGYVVLFAICEVMFIVWAMTGLLRHNPEADVRDRALATEIADPKYARSALDAPARARIRRKLDDAWSTQTLHRDSRLTLRRLCERLRENPHYVSQVINQDLGTNFFELVNRRRIHDAMEALRKDAQRPVLEIALEVGFNSKSTFNAAFREYAGTTPSDFRRTQVAAAPVGASDPAG